MKKKKKYFKLYISTIFVFAIILGISFFNVNSLPDNFYLSYSEIEETNNDNKFGPFVKLELQDTNINTSDEKQTNNIIVFKLFGLIPIKKVTANILPDEEVYVGGQPIGLVVHTDGVMIVSDCEVDLLSKGVKKNSVLKNGDIITNINGVKISSTEDVDAVIDNLQSNFVDVTFIRNNKVLTKQIQLVKNENNKYKLGVWVRDDLSGIGTFTFAKKDNSYAALGHAITNGLNENVVQVAGGNIYNCSLVDITKGQKNKPGELECVFANKDAKGSIDKNTKYGIYGKLYEENEIIDYNLKANLGGRLSVKPGKAKIISSVSGLLEEYEIEIIRAKYQTKCEDKSIIFRVKDKRLLALTGGIVQGMSGSPIVQNGKLVGAVTHVFLNDPNKGYGVYCDWMLKQMDD